MSPRQNKSTQAAGRLYKVSIDSGGDLVEKVFKILKLSQEAPLEETLQTYRLIREKWVTLVEIVTAKELTTSQKEQVEKYLTENMGRRLCFLYDVEPKIIGGIKVRVGDNVFDESILSKVRDITV